MSRFWSPLVQQLKPYVAGEQLDLPGLVKLNTNENPYGPAPEVLAAIQRAAQSGQAGGDALRLYPDPQSSALRQAIATHHGVTPEQVFVGNGSDEVLAHAFQAFFRHGGPLLMPDVSYSFYPVYGQLYGIPCETVPLRADFSVDLQGYARPDGVCAGVVIANPNAPTGIALPLDQIEALLRLHPNRVVLVDEAYVDFGAQSAVNLLDRHPNLLVVQTLSKSRGLAGLRVGYALGSTELIEGLARIKGCFNSYPLDRLAQAGAVASFAAQGYFTQTCSRVMQSRDRLTQGLDALGFEVLPSATNFVFARHPQRDAAELAQALKAQAILVRHFPQPRIAQFLRITVGTDAQCERLLAALGGMVGTAQA
ncbi:MAG: histidinol-phosphate transaminase [Aquabacterium sp.]|uniref:histidinol-phosphate transaminase n=1 Tax=Aquabacterium sp. TaxID=1872578 RepID=UPI0012153E70|nr:histidinol-phosphate transaminase [Aquabacterium sp.]TAK97718.1 MAG: histidinol-phosphate transaminase [Aquabacterium sp.]